MSAKENGGPAFPSGNSEEKGFEKSHPLHEGMTLRDYFAEGAMKGICSHSDTWGLTIEGIATESYKMADAMLTARAATQPPSTPFPEKS